MAKMRPPNPKVTGISEITGKRVSVRHAVEADLVFIKQGLAAHKVAYKPRKLDYREFVVAAKDNSIIAFGRLRASGDAFILEVYESRNRRDVDRLVVEHLIHVASSGALLVIARPKSNYRNHLKELGFKEVPKELAGSNLMMYIKPV